MKKLIGYPLPLGITESHGIVNFSVAVDQGVTCRLCIYRKDSEKPERVLELEKADPIGSVRFVAVPVGWVRGKEYNYEIDGVRKLDPYVRKICVDASTGELRGRILPDSYDWEGDRPIRIPDAEVVAYSLHVRGFTRHRSSGVKKKGSFLGLTEKIPYLKELGVNQIHCMPIYDFEEETPYKNYWGYGKANCFALKKSYAATKRPEKELKDMIKSFHQNGIEVLFNLPFTGEMPKQQIVDCLRYYVTEYHADGFILNPYVAPMDCIRTDVILKEVKVLEDQNEFQTVMRRFLRGDKGCVRQAMLQLKQRGYHSITGQNGFTLADLVSYNRKHNEKNGERNCDGPSVNYSWNCGREGNTGNPEILSLRLRQRKNAMALLLLSQGTPVLLAGDEFGNSQKGNNNVYCQDNETAWLNWGQFEKEKEFYKYVKTLLEIRRNYPFWQSEQPMTGADLTGCGVPDMSYHGEEAWQTEDLQEEPYFGVYYHDAGGLDCFLAYNLQEKEQEIGIPVLEKGKTWKPVFSTGEEQELRIERRKILVPARTILMMEGR